MRRTRRRRRKKDQDEYSWSPPAKKQREQGGGTAATSLPASHQSLLQMQQAHGNAFVQRYVAQKQAQEDLKDKEVELKAPTVINNDGEVEIDLSQLMDLRQFGEIGKRLGESADEWDGIGTMLLGEKSQHLVEEIESTKDGKLILKMHPYFQKEISAVLSEADPMQKPDLQHFFGAGDLEVTATLHYNLEDPEIKESALEDISKKVFPNQKILPRPALLLQFEGEGGQGKLPIHCL